MSDFGPRGEYGRVRERPYRRGGYDREQRLQITLAVSAAILLLVGIGIGFAIGRATAGKATPTPASQPIIQAETTPAVEASVTAETSATLDTSDTAISDETSSSADTTTADTTGPSKPRQTAPANGAVLSTSRVTLRWSKVTDDSGSPVTYSFEIQNRLAGGTYGSDQVITGLKTTSYSARVLTVRRRWRVWAVDAAGNKSAKSVWHSYIHKAVATTTSTTKKSTDTSSTETTTTEH